MGKCYGVERANLRTSVSFSWSDSDFTPLIPVPFLQEWPRRGWDFPVKKRAFDGRN